MDRLTDLVMHPDARTVMALMAALAVCVVAAAWGIRARWDNMRQRRRMRRATEHGLKMEAEAARTLRDLGFEVIDYQFEYTHRYRIDNRDFDVRLRPDYIVARGGRTYVVDVKTGAQARIGSSETRRQLLEYYTTFECDGVLMLDMDRRRLHSFDFAPQARARRRARHRLTAVACVAGLAGMFVPHSMARPAGAAILLLTLAVIVIRKR